VLLLAFCGQLHSAEVRYIRDSLQVPLRSGQTTQHRIVHKGLSSGTKLQLQETSDNGRYSRVTTERGIDGWLQSQYLSTEPSGRDLYKRAQISLKKLTTANESLKKQLQQLNEQYSVTEKQLGALNTKSGELSTELQQVKDISANAIRLNSDNHQLLEDNQQLKNDLDILATNNRRLRDDDSNDAFLNGAFVLLIGVMITLLVPRLWPGKKSSEWAWPICNRSQCRWHLVHAKTGEQTQHISPHCHYRRLYSDARENTMRTSFFIMIAFTAVLALVCGGVNAQSAANPTAVISTSKGDITIELFEQRSPLSVANFIRYAQSGFYDGTIFHRVIKRFMIQGGGFNRDMARKSTFQPVANESRNGLRNNRWTLAMARTQDPDSATAQFFINVNMNSSLDAGSGKLGYSVFGQVTDGQYVVQAIEKVPVQSSGRFANLPIEPVIITKVTIKRTIALAPISVDTVKPVLLMPANTSNSESQP